MKSFISIILFGCITMNIGASPKLASKEQIGMFLNSKTCIVLENGSISYNVYVKEAVQIYWKITPFEFIDQQEFEKRRFNSKYSFLVLMKGVYDKDPGGISYNYISLVLGNGTPDLTNMPELCSIPISYSDDNNVNYGYAIPAIIKFMQIDAKNLQYKRFQISWFGLKYYNGILKTKDKVLLLNKDMMAPDANSPDKIKAVYPHYFKLVNTTEIQTEIASNPVNTLFNFHVGPTQNSGAGKCFEMIFDVEGNLYYYNYRKITNDNKDGFNLKDFEYFR